MFFMASVVENPTERRFVLSDRGISLLPSLLAGSIENRDFFQGRVHLTWSRAPRYGVFDFYEDGSLLIMLAGYARRIGEDRFLGPKDVLDSVWHRNEERFGGQYLIIIYDDSSGRVIVLNTLSRLIPAYSYASTNELVVSNRQTQLGVSAGLSEIDDHAFAPFAGEGYFPHEAGLFRHLSLAPPDTRTEWRFPDPSSGVSVQQLSDTLEMLGSVDPLSADFDRIGESLRRAFVPVVPDAGIRVGLSGGRDSRLIVAALRAADADFSVYTNSSTDDHSDDVEVEIASRVAEALGVTQDIRLPKKTSNDSARQDIDLVDRFVAVAKNSDFSVFGHEGIGSNPEKYDLKTIQYNGGGGELLRQAYGGRAWRDRNMAERVVLRHLYVERFGLDLTWYREWLNEWIESNGHLSSGALLNKFSLMYRTGRWGAGIYNSTYARISQRPFYDNEWLTAVLPLRSEWTASDILYYETLKRLAPDLLNVPFAGTREWALASSEMPKYRTIGTRLPGSLPLTRQVAGNVASRPVLPWRQAIAGSLGADLLRILRSANEELGLFPEIYLQSLEQRRTNLEEAEHDRRLAKALWASASGGVMIAALRGQGGFSN